MKIDEGTANDVARRVGWLLIKLADGRIKARARDEHGDADFLTDWRQSMPGLGGATLRGHTPLVLDFTDGILSLTIAKREDEQHRFIRPEAQLSGKRAVSLELVEDDGDFQVEWDLLGAPGHGVSDKHEIDAVLFEIDVRAVSVESHIRRDRRGTQTDA